MIGSVEQTQAQAAGALATPQSLTESGGFDAALEAAKRAQAKQEASDAQIQSIREKGFRKWVGEMQLEKLKEELRKKVMAAMGLDEDSLDNLTPAIRQILEQKIQEEVERELEKEMAKIAEGDGTGKSSESAGSKAGGQQEGAATQQQAVAGTGQNQSDDESRGGRKCPVIPALAWPGQAPISSFF